MQPSLYLAISALLVGSGLAGPINQRAVAAGRLFTRDGATAESIILQIAPDSASCSDTTECRTAAQAAPYLVDAMSQYGVTQVGAIAGVLSLMAFESVSFEYKHNVSPGRPGQGTANMQMFSYNQQYASSIPALASQVSALGSDVTSDDGMNALLALVTPDEYNFGSGPWYLSTFCSDIRDELNAGTDAGFSAYMGCVGTTMTSDRQAFWDRAKTAFGLSG
ncbi:hypothetical protein BX600DRAFT_508369 [Xylariales sp. PMI_506]|nr:hypothetical protein BX600DRAFT_508369 [Xylariales sp. PMI_506]